MSTYAELIDRARGRLPEAEPEEAPPRPRRQVTDLAGSMGIEIALGPIGEAIGVLEDLEDLGAARARARARPPAALRPRESLRPGPDRSLRGPGQ